MLYQCLHIFSLVYFKFLNVVVSFSFLYLVLPASQTQTIFTAQLETIARVVQGSPTGNYISSFSAFGSILSNNLKILILCIVFSFIYGAGAIFILTWNASVMAVAISSFIKYELLNVTTKFGILQITTVGLLKYLTHGIPEIMAYFVGALASGMISIAIIKHQHKNKKFKQLLRDSASLVAISVLLLVAAALVEVYITPIVV